MLILQKNERAAYPLPVREICCCHPRSNWPSRDRQAKARPKDRCLHVMINTCEQKNTALCICACACACIKVHAKQRTGQWCAAGPWAARIHARSLSISSKSPIGSKLRIVQACGAQILTNGNVTQHHDVIRRVRGIRALLHLLNSRPACSDQSGVQHDQLVPVDVFFLVDFYHGCESKIAKSKEKKRIAKLLLL